MPELRKKKKPPPPPPPPPPQQVATELAIRHLRRGKPDKALLVLEEYQDRYL